MNRSVFLLLAGTTLILNLTYSAHAASPDKDIKDDEPKAMMKDSDYRSTLNELINNSANVYRALIRGDQGAVPQSVLKKAQCVAIIPNAITAAAVIGGTHGDGVVSCKMSNGNWSDVSFFDLNGGSIGLALGAKSTDLVAYFTSDQAVAALKKGKIELGADASVVAGTFDKSFDTTNAGVVAYQNSSGAFIGASLTGGSLSRDDESNRNFYGKDVSATGILEGTSRGTAQPNSLIPLLPQPL